MVKQFSPPVATFAYTQVLKVQRNLYHLFIHSLPNLFDDWVIYFLIFSNLSSIIEKMSKRSKPIEEGMWDCSVCTYKNPSEAFKCEMCDVRKGTSTRKPRINPQLVAQQVAQHIPTGPPPQKKEKKEKDSKEREKDGESQSPTAKISPSGTNSQKEKKKSNRPPRLKNIDRSSGTSMAVTVDDVTVIITDYKPKKPKPSVTQSQEGLGAGTLSVATPPATPDHTHHNCVDNSNPTHSQPSQNNPGIKEAHSSESSSFSVPPVTNNIKNTHSDNSDIKTET